jgi:hypothetical protein
VLAQHNPYFFQYAKQTYDIIASSNGESIVQLFRFVCVSINVFDCYKCNYIDMFLLYNILREQDNILREQYDMLWEKNTMLWEQNIFLVGTK